jgi:hypothetical protein
LRQQDAAELKAVIAQLAAQLAAFEQRAGRRFLALETRLANLETRFGALETTVGSMAQDIPEILRRLPAE